MASNDLEKNLATLKRAILPLVKGYLLQDGAFKLSTMYRRYLQTNTVPDRRSKRTGNLYYSQPNTTNRLRTLYGNLQRALSPDGRFPGNITEVTVSGNEVVLNSGIDLDAKVKAGNRTTTLFYAQIHELGLNGKPRPFLEPGIRDFNREVIPEILDDIADELQRFYRGR